MAEPHDARNDAEAAIPRCDRTNVAWESQLMLAGLSTGGSDDVLGNAGVAGRDGHPVDPIPGRKVRLLMALNQERDLLKVIDVPTMR